MYTNERKLDTYLIVGQLDRRGHKSIAEYCCGGDRRRKVWFGVNLTVVYCSEV